MTRKCRQSQTFPALLLIPVSAPLLAYCLTSITLYRLSPEHLLLLSVQHDSMFIPICLSSASCLRGLAPICHAQSSPCLRTQCSCAFAYLCRSLPALSRKYICLLGHTAAFASFLLCKGRASVMLQGSQSLLATKKFQRFWGAVAPGPNSLRP